MSDMKNTIACAGILVGFLGAAIGAKYLLNDPQQAEDILSRQGYSSIQVDESPVIWGCGDDFKGNAFTATNPTGQKTSGKVCRGVLFTDADIRFD